MHVCFISVLEPVTDQQLPHFEILELPEVDYSSMPLTGRPGSPREDAARKPSAESSWSPETRGSTSYDGYVLAVDDEVAIREALHDLLEDEGYQVVEAVDGLEALEYLRATKERYVVLLDYTMPRMNGLEVLRAVAADPRLVTQHAFILMTANITSPQGELATMLARYSIPLISKPFQFSPLLQAVERAAHRLSAS